MASIDSVIAERLCTVCVVCCVRMSNLLLPRHASFDSQTMESGWWCIRIIIHWNEHIINYTYVNDAYYVTNEFYYGRNGLLFPFCLAHILYHEFDLARAVLVLIAYLLTVQINHSCRRSKVKRWCFPPWPMNRCNINNNNDWHPIVECKRMSS